MFRKHLAKVHWLTPSNKVNKKYYIINLIIIMYLLTGAPERPPPQEDHRSPRTPISSPLHVPPHTNFLWWSPTWDLCCVGHLWPRRAQGTGTSGIHQYSVGCMSFGSLRLFCRIYITWRKITNSCLCGRWAVWPRGAEVYTSAPWGQGLLCICTVHKSPGLIVGV